MPRTVAVPCTVCGRRFGGDEALRRHRLIAGDRHRCLSPAEMYERNYWQDDWGVWHRGATLRLPLSTGPVSDSEPRLLVRRTDPVTSQLAAGRVAPRTGTLKARLLAAYLDAPEGLTDHEAALRTGIPHQSVTKRAADLRRDGLIAVVGERPGPYGVPVSVCRAVVQEAAS